MRRCPVCNRTYNDQSLNFCEEDGATLAEFKSFNEPSGFGQQPQGFAAIRPVTASPKKSNALLWVLGIFVALIIVGLAGFIGLVALIAAYGDNTNNNSTGVVINSNKGDIFGKTSTSGKAYKVDFKRWNEFKESYGEASLVGDEYQMACKFNNYFYVRLSSSKYDNNLMTNNATTKVTVRSVTGTSPTLGYGLVINSDTQPLKSDYAFVIFNGTNPQFRVVRHVDKKETIVKPWTAASQIRTGTQTNQLEVRTSGKTMSFYINGQLATTITDESGSDQGIAGIYTSDTQAIGFSNLEVIKN